MHASGGAKPNVTSTHSSVDTTDRGRSVERHRPTGSPAKGRQGMSTAQIAAALLARASFFLRPSRLFEDNLATFRGPVVSVACGSSSRKRFSFTSPREYSDRATSNVDGNICVRSVMIYETNHQRLKDNGSEDFASLAGENPQRRHPQHLRDSILGQNRETSTKRPCKRDG